MTVSLRERARSFTRMARVRRAFRDSLMEPPATFLDAAAEAGVAWRWHFDGDGPIERREAHAARCGRHADVRRPGRPGIHHASASSAASAGAVGQTRGPVDRLSFRLLDRPTHHMTNFTIR